MKKILALMLSVVMMCSFLGIFAACDFGDKPIVGLICLHGESSTYDKNFIDAFKAAAKAKGLTEKQYRITTDVPEGVKCYDEASDMVDSGCKAVFADSFGHEPYMIQAAEKYKDAQFYHATGTQAPQKKYDNYHNAFASIYQGRYLAGYAAGLKLNTMKNKAVNNVFTVGYVGAWTYAEVISGFTSWFLGLQAALDTGYTAEMKVQFTGSWYDETAEKTAAETLISKGCVLISQHADSMGAPTACQSAGVPNVSYNGSTGLSTLVAYSKIDWQPYFEMMIDNAKNGTAVPTDFCGTIDNGSVKYELGANIASGTAEKLATVENEIKSGNLKIFDCSKFTKAGRHLTSYLADVDGNNDEAGNVNVIKTVNGKTFFDESNASEFRSAPYFDIKIDGVTYLNAVYGSDDEGNPIFIPGDGE